MIETAEMGHVEYGGRVRAMFESRGLQMLGWGREWLEASGRGWTESAKWDSESVQATIDGLRVARAMAEIERRVPGVSQHALAEVALKLPLGLTAQDLEELDGGAWKSHVEACAPPDARERLIWALAERKPLAFALQSEGAGFNPGKDPWASWIASKGVAWLAERIELALAAFEAFAASDLVSEDRGSLRRSFGWIGERLGEEPGRGDFAARMAALLLRKGWAAQGLDWFLSASLADGRDSAGEIVGTLAEAMGFSGLEVEGMWSQRSPWVSAGVMRVAKAASRMELLSQYGRSASLMASGRVVDDAKHKLFDSSRLSVMEKPWRSEAELMECFYRPFEGGEGLALSDWAHVGAEVDDVARAIGRAPVKVLLWGEPGSGKSSLAAVLARECGRLAIEPAPGSRGEELDKANDNGLLRLWQVEAAERLGAAVGSPLLVVDECETILTDEDRKLEIAKCLEGRSSPQIWIANSLAGAHEAFLRRFDFVLKVPPMPLASREALARRLFEDASLATRLAQSMRNPAEIVAAAHWCAAAGETSWSVVSRRMAGHQHAVGASRSGEKSSFEVVPAGSIGLKIEDFAGSARLRGEIERIAGFFSDPGRFAKLGAKIPKGYLLSGSAGSGKTLFVRVLASVAGVPMVVANGAALAEEPERFAELFAEARKRAPCLVFVDEFDVCAGHVRGLGGMSLERQKILNRLLVELDGFDPLEGVLFLGATHNGDAIDEAVKRAGRLGRELGFGAPSPEARCEIWRAHLPEAIAAPEVDWAELSQSSRGFSNAEIAEAAERAKLEAATMAMDSVGMPELLTACAEVFWGEPGELYMDEDERWRTAVHEAGHALAATRKGLRPERATVRPRKGFLGAVAVRDKEGSMSMDLAGVKAQLVVGLAGFAAEKAVFGSPSNGASADLANARSILEGALLEWGLGASPAGYLEGTGGKALSQGALREFERESEKFMGAALDDLEKMFEAEREVLARLARELLDRRELTRKEIESCVGAAPALRLAPP